MKIADNPRRGGARVRCGGRHNTIHNNVIRRGASWLWIIVGGKHGNKWIRKINFTMFSSRSSKSSSNTARFSLISSSSRLRKRFSYSSILRWTRFAKLFFFYLFRQRNDFQSLSAHLTVHFFNCVSQSFHHLSLKCFHRNPFCYVLWFGLFFWQIFGHSKTFERSYFFHNYVRWYFTSKWQKTSKTCALSLENRYPSKTPSVSWVWEVERLVCGQGWFRSVFSNKLAVARTTFFFFNYTCLFCSWGVEVLW